MFVFNISSNFYNYFCVVFSLHCIMFLGMTRGTADARKLSPPATDFNKHRTVQPAVHHGRTKRAISSTRDTSGAHHSELTMKVPIDDRELVLDLQLNRDLITDNHVLRYQEGGKTVIHKPKKEDIDLCQYSGTVRGMPGSWVAVSTCHGIRGVIFDGEQMRYIEPAEGDEIQSQHYVYDHSELSNHRRRGYVSGVSNNTRHDPLMLKKHYAEKDKQPSTVNRYKRSAEDSQVRGPYNANSRSRYVELVLVADNREYIKSGRNLRKLHHKLKDIANIINSVYAPLNIFIALVGVEVWTRNDNIPLSANSSVTLTKFLEYRRDHLVLDLPNDNAHLLTWQQFDEGVVGKATRGTICRPLSGGIATDHSTVIGLVAATIAHEMGHNFDMDHDGYDCECPDERCIMNAYSNSDIPTKWSSCSLRSLALAFEKGFDYCLRNKPKRLFESPTCGNGFVEPGEQCDCGTAAASACHACCQPDTCMLRRNATCAAGACCDLQTCRPRSAGTQCRPAERECDLPEYCTGHSEFCPDDVYKMDTTPCGRNDDRAYCAGGRCGSHSSQCRLLWGPSGEPSHSDCYTKFNVLGEESANCGFDQRSQQFRRCSPQDTMCGTLQCQHLARKLVFATWSTVVTRYHYNDNRILQCHATTLDPKEINAAFGMVPDGARCGHEMMCAAQRCVAVAGVRARIAARDSSVCPSNCSGHGVCNSQGRCHCEAGFAPPLCAAPGAGGSHGSGPSTDPATMKYTMVAIYVIFLGIIPAVLLMFLMNYFRRDLAAWCHVHLLLCGGCRTNTKRTIVNGFRDTTSSIRRLLSFKSNAPNDENTDCIYKKGDTREIIQKIKRETKLNIATQSNGERKIDKCDIHKVTGPSNDEHIYANLNTNTKLHSDLKIIEKPIKKTKITIEDIHIVPSGSKVTVTPYNCSNKYENMDKSTIMKTPAMDTNTKIDLKPKMLKIPAIDTNTKMNLKPQMLTIPAIDTNTKVNLKPQMLKIPAIDTNTKMNLKPQMLKIPVIDTNTKMDLKPKMLTIPAIDTNTKMDLKPNLVLKPIKRINNDTQIASGSIKAGLPVKLKPTPKPVLAKDNRPSTDNLELKNNGTVADIRRMFDT